ncbi:MAG: hypothetical protein JWR26_3337 [Pedosphaera sp.]|nr:hypothetical protein [Pedosphaera sp.]
MHWLKECVAVIPCLDEAATIFPLVQAVSTHLNHVIVVDDGSADATSLLATKAGAEVLQHKSTMGKGAALNTGWRRAVERGFAWALTMDGDGQHAPEDIPAFLSAACDGRSDLVIGNRMANTKRMPWVRRRVNQWMSRRLSNAAGVSLPDSQCGFRLMRLDAWSRMTIQSAHFEIESEVLLAFISRGYVVRFVPIQTIYGAEQSKIHPVQDTLRWLRWWRRTRRGTGVKGD